MITFTTNAAAIQKLSELLKNNAKKIRKEIYIALNETAKNLQSQWAKEIGQELAVAQKEIKKTLRREIAKEGGELKSSVTQNKDKRLPLKLFKPSFTKTGVTYRAYKEKDRLKLRNSFIPGQRGRYTSVAFGGHVFTRQGAKRLMTKGRYAGKMRQPIVKRYGPSAFDTTKKFEISKTLTNKAQERLIYELNKRIRRHTHGTK
jgi:gas vesicle protein